MRGNFMDRQPSFMHTQQILAVPLRTKPDHTTGRSGPDYSATVQLNQKKKDKTLRNGYARLCRITAQSGLISHVFGTPGGIRNPSRRHQFEDRGGLSGWRPTVWITPDSHRPSFWPRADYASA